MHVIAVAAQKGGAGKSTLACHLAVLADQDARPALLIDSDPQGSAAFWHGLRSKETPALVQCEPREIGDFEGAGAGADEMRALWRDIRRASIGVHRSV